MSTNQQQRKASSSSSAVRAFQSPFLSDSSTSNTALIILNSPIQRPPSLLFEQLWNMSTFRVCADGGANRLYDATVDNDDVVTSSYFIPDVIRGDLDSLRLGVRSYYESRGTLVEQDGDQDTNDLDKALQLVDSSRIKWVDDNAERSRVCVYGAFGGRFDQEMGCIQALYKWGDVFDYHLVLYDDQTCAFLLPPNVCNEIRLPFVGEAPPNESLQDKSGLVGEGPTCGLIPIGCRCESVKTTGLKWDLDGTMPLEFGGLVSTSNRAMNEVVTVTPSHPLVFTAEMTSIR